MYAANSASAPALVELAHRGKTFGDARILLAVGVRQIFGYVIAIQVPDRPRDATGSPQPCGQPLQPMLEKAHGSAWVEW